MGTTAHLEAIREDRSSGASWRAVAEALAGELAEVRRRLIDVERILGLPVPPAAPEWCHRRSGLAVREANSPQAAPSPPLMPPSFPATGLSRREVQVLALLAAGRSNRDIARALFLSPRTVQRHVANLYPKIGAHNRAEATAFAIHHGLR